MGRTSYVQDDIAKGRLVVPFKIALPADAGFYLVSPEGVAEPPKLRAFRQWLIASAKKRGECSPSPWRGGVRGGGIESTVLVTTPLPNPPPHPPSPEGGLRR